jgi:O-methyltransferase domain
MAPDSELLIIERVIPAGGEPSLALEWDIHMLANTGGRERTAAEYNALLDRSGFELRGQAHCPLDLSALVAAPRTSI